MLINPGIWSTHQWGSSLSHWAYLAISCWVVWSFDHVWSAKWGFWEPDLGLWEKNPQSSFLHPSILTMVKRPFVDQHGFRPKSWTIPNHPSHGGFTQFASMFTFQWSIYSKKIPGCILQELHRIPILRVICWGKNQWNRIKHHTLPFRCLYPHCKPRFGADRCRPQGPGQALRGSVRAPGKVVMNRGSLWWTNIAIENGHL